MKNYQRLQGLVAATFTPMLPDGDIHYAVIDQYAQHIAGAGISGVFVCGTTGEFTSLTTEERKLILEHWIRAAEGRFKVIAHVGSDNQRESVELSRHAAESGAWGVGSIAPSFFKPSSVRDLIDFFKPVAAAAAELPFYYYNMPAMTGVSLSVAQFLQEGKQEIPNLAGVKYTHNNLMEMGDCIHLDNGAFEVLHGYDEILICGLALGAVAGVGSTYNYLASVYLNIMKAMEEGDLVSARVFQMQSIEVVKVIIKYGGGVRGGKAIMNLIGIECGECRLPIAPFGKEEYDSLRKDLEGIGFRGK
ncbi:MAG: dihydrodipicolinate synthase family protein [Proteiniphilum sp.]|jgi:N-acetylneuraminate lyase|uniref:dihydrodipicolinate synthase family protein n=1 Tax=Proteiniphilum sp. TaxID=1926877 RepID=UPI00092C69C6|nr:dihydrodipicolinate synthase family protein [Proteiniphilum sp.]MEA5127933.1 dihydrodipicolinate synthase family protein [Proteiniphilum sp.]OJV78468.1 MAG: N-acetylneuraminate lyase [Bacteroidia bacterium 44-10]